MKVLNLRCAHEHDFEGWFASEDDFQGQLQRGLVECPMCGASDVRKLLSAPRLNFGASAPQQKRPERVAASTAAPMPAADLAKVDLQLQQRWLEVARQVMAHTEDVGSRFSEEARKMHYGETPDRPIRGQTTEQERQALHDEGIEVLTLPLPQAAKEVMH